jgi:hypothetical protein
VKREIGEREVEKRERNEKYDRVKGVLGIREKEEK